MADTADEMDRAAPPQVLVDPDPVDRASRVLVDAILSVLAKQSIARLAIPGGSALGVAAKARILLGGAWQRVALTWVDERCLPVEDARSNRGAAAALGLFSSDPMASTAREPACVLPLYLDGETPSEAIERAEAGLETDFGSILDVVLLGMGPDGHVASLFPAPVRSEAGMVAFVPDSPKPPAERMTLTRAAMATACRVILVAAGEAKRNALRRLVEGDSSLPAYGMEGLVIVTDLAGIEIGRGENVG